MTETLFEQMERTATLSECGTYRYRLGRRWGNGPAVTWVMLNPSTADADVDDPTIRRCIGFARAWGYDAIEVVNLYALRATDPKALSAARPARDQENASVLVEASYKARAGGLVVVAWGAHPMAVRGAGSVERMFAAAGAECLGRTKGGHPRHPLYVRTETLLEPWS